ncbi:SUR7/PalI family-domain-containing protein [Halenospora varia]|nr:SUR7/PalI family-domain-containing protein [Halenospora varia]
MANTGIFHHIGTFLLFAATILLLITTISSPVVNDIAILKVKINDNSAITFGTFGYCTTSSSGDDCTGKHIGYNPALVMEGIDNTDFSRASMDTSKALTRVMILHPIACGVSFIAFLLALGSGFCGAIAAAMVSVIAWIITIVVMITDFVLFGIIKRHVNNDGSGSNAYFTTAMWTLLVAMLCLFLGTILVLLTCCSSRMHRQNKPTKHAESGYANGTTTTRRHFWQRRTRY